MSNDVRVTTTGGSGNWRGALRLGRVTLASCGHAHRNRDSGAAAARHCAEALVRAARNPEIADRWINDRVRAAAQARSLGARLTDVEALAKAEATASTWREVVIGNDFHLPRPFGTPTAATCGCCPAAPATAETANLERIARHRTMW